MAIVEITKRYTGVSGIEGGGLIWCCVRVHSHIRSNCSFCDRFQLKAGTRQVSTEKQVDIYPELCSWFPTEYRPGGAGLTTIRVAQWMLHLERATTIIGAVGRDEKADRLRESCERAGICHAFFVQDDEPTGAVARLHCDNVTTELTHLAAVNTYSKQRHLDQGSKPIPNVAARGFGGFFCAIFHQNP